MNRKNKINPIFKKVTIARLNALSDRLQIHIGSNQNYTKNDLIGHIHRETKIGQQMVDIQINFLRDLAHGKIYQDV